GEPVDQFDVFKLIIKEYSTDLIREAFISTFDGHFVEDDTREKIGVDFWLKNMYVDNIRTALQIWLMYDVTPELKRNEPYYYAGTYGAIFVFPKNDRESFERAKTGYLDFKKVMGDKCHVFFTGVKNEPEVVTAEEGKLFTGEMVNVEYHEMNNSPQEINELLELMTKKFLFVGSGV
ncbi:MAG: hypothetical protein ACFFD4_18945, partial [Candidatus Odinarchaeota archaeon]